MLWFFRFISYAIYSSYYTCGGFDSLEKNDVLEFSIRLLSNPSEWIPLSFTHFNRRTTSNCRRGFCVQDEAVLSTAPDSTYDPYSWRNIQICGFPLNDSIQLRWLMSSFHSSRINGDKWSLDDVNMYLIIDNNNKSVIVDNFDASLLKWVIGKVNVFL